MMLYNFAFYLSSIVMLGAGLGVIMASNPVRAVLWLIVSFFSASALFLLLGAEFLAMILIIVYVGAVAVLFLFVVMMLDVTFSEAKAKVVRYLPIGLTVGGLLLFELLITIQALDERQLQSHEASNTLMLGRILYTDYLLPFQVAGLVLLTAMVGAIILSLRHREGVKKQNITDQVMRSRKDAIEVLTDAQIKDNRRKRSAS